MQKTLSTRADPETRSASTFAAAAGSQATRGHSAKPKTKNLIAPTLTSRPSPRNHSTFGKRTTRPGGTGMAFPQRARPHGRPRAAAAARGDRREDAPTEDPSSRGPVHSRLHREDLSSEGTRLTRAAFPSAAADDAPAPERPYCDSAAAHRAQKSRHDTIGMATGGSMSATGEPPSLPLPLGGFGHHGPSSGPTPWLAHSLSEGGPLGNPGGKQGERKARPSPPLCPAPGA